MRLLVIGSGLLGVTTAYFLRRRGYEVTVVERRDGPGLETSFANGALLHPSLPEPWNAPGCWRTLLTSLGRSDAAMQLRLHEVPRMLTWGAQFLRNSRTTAFQRSLRSNLQLALYSLQVMHSLRSQTDIEYGRAARGTLRIFRNAGALSSASAAATRLAQHGLRFRTLSAAEVLALEPALEPIGRHLAGGMYYELDETGDAHRFCVSLAERARAEGVDFHFQTEVASLRVEAGRVRAALSAREEFVADKFIVAAGSYSTPLLRKIGIRLPIRPVKGYSLTIPHDQTAGVLKIPVIDDHLHAAVVPLEKSIRVAGTAEFGGYDSTLDPRRVANLVTLLRQVLPDASFDLTRARPWCGLRPVCVDGVPLIGETPISNLLVNTGHGHLGWTMAAGSAQLLVNSLSGDPPGIDAQRFHPARFRLV